MAAGILFLLGTLEKGKRVSRKASLPSGCQPERSFSEIEPTEIGLVGFFLPAIYFRGKTDGRLVI
jgi:hypothetical protein